MFSRVSVGDHVAGKKNLIKRLHRQNFGFQCTVGCWLFDEHKLLFPAQMSVHIHDSTHTMRFHRFVILEDAIEPS